MRTDRPTLTVLPGGVDPSELRELTSAAERALSDLADALPPGDHLVEPCSRLAQLLRLEAIA